MQLLPVQPAQPIPDWFPSGGKSIAIIKDDRTDNFGPAAFDKHTIHRLVAAAASLIVCSGPPVKQVYAAAAFMVELGGHVVLVECQPHRHEEWIGNYALDVPTRAMVEDGAERMPTWPSI